MTRIRVRAGAGLIVGLVMVAIALSAPRAADDAGRTGVTRPDEVIMARQLLMDGVEAEMMAIEVALAGREARIDALKDRAYTIFTYLTVAPHLFPPETMPAKAADGSVTNGTSALPGIWEDFDAFYEQLTTGASTAFDASQASDASGFRGHIAKLREACDSCHAKFMSVETPR